LFAGYVPDGPSGPTPADLVVRHAGLRDVGPIARLLAERNGWDEAQTAKRTEHGVSQPRDASFYGVAETAGSIG